MNTNLKIDLIVEMLRLRAGEVMWYKGFTLQQIHALIRRRPHLQTRRFRMFEEEGRIYIVRTK